MDNHECLKLENYSLMKCSTSKAVEAVPKKRPLLDLSRVREKLEAESVEIEISTPILLIVKFSLPTSIYRNGKIIVKNTESHEEAREVIKRFFEAVNK